MENEGKVNEKSGNKGLDFIQEILDEFNEKFPRPKEDGDAEEGEGHVVIRVVKKQFLTLENPINRDESPTDRSDGEKNEDQPSTDKER